MDKIKRFSALIISFLAIAISCGVGYSLITPEFQKMKKHEGEIVKLESDRNNLNKKIKIVKDKIAKIKESIVSAQKKIYSPIESDLGNETLFFTLYNDVIEMVHANKIKIRSIDYDYNPDQDPFVKYGKDAYFVSDVNMVLVSNYVDLGKLIQDLYQYSYYVKINQLDVKPYEKDKKILISNISLRLYARTEPEDAQTSNVTEKVQTKKETK